MKLFILLVSLLYVLKCSHASIQSGSMLNKQLMHDPIDELDVYIKLMFDPETRSDVNNTVALLTDVLNFKPRYTTQSRRLTKVKAVGSPLVRYFMALTEIPPPKPPKHNQMHEPHIPPDSRRMHEPHNAPDGRRLLDPECDKTPAPSEVIEGGHVRIFGDYYDEWSAKTVATVIIPDHIDHIYYEVSTQVPYLTVGPIDGLGYHPTTMVTGECEKIYQDHMADQYSDETQEDSEESLEMAKMPYIAEGTMSPFDERAEAIYSDQ